ncbi:MAG: hypothetical protein ACK5Y2_01735 [Bdellovibrionales bacterium]
MDPDASKKLRTRSSRKATPPTELKSEDTQGPEIRTEDSNGLVATVEDEPHERPFKIEWSLFWEGLLGDHADSEKDGLESGGGLLSPVQPLSRDKIQALIKDLSNQRKLLHKQIEKLNKEIELSSTKVESLRLVGSEPEETLNRINELTDRGQELSLQLEKLDRKLKWARACERNGDVDPDLA